MTQLAYGKHELGRVGRAALVRRGAAITAALAVVCALLVVGQGRAHAADPDTNRVATWNMQVGSDRWQGAAVIARDNTVLALQEVPGTRPASATYLGTNGNIDTYFWDIGGGNYRNLYILRQPSRNLAIATTFNPGAVVEVPGYYRSALMVTHPEDDVAFASIHAASGTGFDVRALVQDVADETVGRGINHWAVLGDFNLNPLQAAGLNLPQDSRIYNTGEATHQGGGELDYMITNVATDNWQATRGINRGSDHWPVYFLGMRAGAEPAELTIHAESSGRFLDVFEGRDSNGTHVIQYHENGAVNQRWRLQPIGTSTTNGHTMYRVMSSDSGKCLDIANGQSSHAGDYLNIWDCHDIDGLPTPGGNQHDTQNFTLEHPLPWMPNLTLLRNNATGLYANINHNETGDGAWVIQWPDQFGAIPVPNETFYLHPNVANQ
ncbi:RICIN domain-containing protein [Embleya sp. NPDC059237]|uniref:RICIN domain-containing protein n=1 Tax=Embleya sp. NPDC059237 TaxID=3346784 RepID=UPI003691D392